jgi:hypothetical protein
MNRKMTSFSGFSLAGFLVALCLLFGYPKIYAQQEEVTATRVKVSGMVKSDFFFDTRQTVSAREGHFLLFPSAKVNDADGNDINAKSSFNFLPVQSNLSVSITGPKTLGATTTSLIEGDFFGISNGDVNMLRLRHAFVKLQWTKAELLIGQYWHPLFVTSCYPGTVSFNTGVPIQPFSRAPQIRVSYIPGIIKFTGTLLSQRDYASVGPDGVSSKYLRDASIPEIQINGELTLKNKNEFILGTGFGYKLLMPQTKTGKGFQTSERVSGMSANAYIKHVSKNMTLKLQAVYLENGSEFLTLSGYAVKDTLDADKGLVSYVPVKTVSYWGDIQSGGKLLQAGLFAGYTENLGTGTDVKGPYYLTANMPIKSLYRISPRLTVKPGMLTFALEVEYTSALYGTTDSKGEISNTDRVNNTRFLISSIYKF